MNGRSVDAPSLSTSSSVNTVSSGILNIGSNYNGNLDTNGTFDEVRISSIERGMRGLRILMKVKGITHLI